MKLHKLTILILSLFILAATVNAQGKLRKDSREKIKSLKIGFLTEKLDLSAKEAQKFWPLYNTFIDKIDSLRKSQRAELEKKITLSGGINEIDENESKRIVELNLFTEKELTKTHQEFTKELSKIIPYKKILKLQIAEREFKFKMFNRLKQRRD